MVRFGHIWVLMVITCGAASVALADTKVTCAVNLAKGDITNSEIAIQCGLTEQQVAVIRADLQQLQKTADETQALLIELVKRTDDYARLRQAGITENALIELARRVSADVTEPDQAFRELERAVGIAIDVQTRAASAIIPGDLVDEVLRQMAAQSAIGDFDGAAATGRSAYQDWKAAEDDRQQQARTTGLRLLSAGLEQELLRRDAAAAAAIIDEQIALDNPDQVEHFYRLRVVQDEYYFRGDDKGLNLDLDVSIHLARLCLARAVTQDQRGAALVILGISLSILGEREGSTERLEQAVQAYRDALLEYTRDRAPLNWAMTQNNLGAALSILGEREGNTDRLKQAEQAHRDALLENTRDRVPLDWAATQIFLGVVLFDLGKSEGGTIQLEQAVQSYRNALLEYTRERLPLDWAMTQNNLGNALGSLGRREDSTELLEQAVRAYRDALLEYTRDRVPLDWATAQDNLGTALATLGEREGSADLLEQALQAYREALLERTRDRVPLQWAMSFGNEGEALRRLADLGQDATMATTALRQLTEAEAAMREGGHIPSADYYASRIPLAQALVDRLAPAP